MREINLKLSILVVAVLVLASSLVAQTPAPKPAPEGRDTAPAQELEQKPDALEKFSGIAWGASLSEAMALHPELRCQKDRSGIMGDTVCRLSPTAAAERAQTDATKQYEQAMRTWKKGDKIPESPTAREPDIAIFFRDDKLVSAEVKFIKSELGGKILECTAWPAVRGAMVEKYGAPTDRDTEIQYDSVNEKAVDRERLYWSRGGKVVAFLSQLEEKLSACPELRMVARTELERARKTSESEKEKVKAKF
jgi:hypothetical protein